MRLGQDDVYYDEINDMGKLLNTLAEKLEDFNTEQDPMNLVFFDDAVKHIASVTRILSQPRGNAMLIGVAGCGK